MAKSASRLRGHEHAETLAVITEAFQDAQRDGLSKISQLRDAVSALVGSGGLKEGTKLPGERQLCAAVGLSLGTVQKALALLVRDGDLLREHGRGTFVRHNRHAMQALWHYRFLDPATHARLPVYARILDRRLVAADPFLVQHLGPDSEGYVRIRRLINIGDRFECWSDMHLPASRFKRMLTLKISRLESVNLKQLLSEEFGAPTVSVSQTARVIRPPAPVASKLRIDPSAHCLLLQIEARSRRADVISYQQIYVPPNDCELEITENLHDQVATLAA
jgi:GntR family transcriptional regulator